MIKLLIVLILFCIIGFIKFKYNYKEFVVCFYSEAASRLGITWMTLPAIKEQMPDKYAMGFKFITSLMIHKFRIGITIR